MKSEESRLGIGGLFFSSLAMLVAGLTARSCGVVWLVASVLMYVAVAVLARGLARLFESRHSREDEWLLSCTALCAPRLQFVRVDGRLLLVARTLEGGPN